MKGQVTDLAFSASGGHLRGMKRGISERVAYSGGVGSGGSPQGRSRLRASAIGVASGKSNANDVKTAGATLVLPDLTDPQLVQRSSWASKSVST